MGILVKIEEAINRVLLLIGALIGRCISKITPSKIKLLTQKIFQKKDQILFWLKNLPQYLKQNLPIFFAYLKKKIASYQIKDKLQSSYKNAMTRYNGDGQVTKMGRLKKVFMAPVLVVGQWLEGLTTAQSMMLLGFSAASVLAGISLIFSGQRLLGRNESAFRSPASVEVDYERPDYYKKETRFVTITSIRLPVYYPEVNETKTVDIDMTATLSNRMSRMQVDKLEMQFRDHLISHLELIKADFSLTEEGKEIMRQKLLAELNDFMKEREIEGQVTEVKITYLLAN